MRFSGRSVAIGTLFLTALVPACSDEPPQELAVRGTEMAFESPPSVAPGAYLLRFSNDGLVYHEVAVRQADGEVLGRVSAASGRETSMKIELSAGVYELGCFEPGHYEQGMRETLLVE